MGTFRTLAPHLERVLIRIPGVHCAKLGAPSLSRSTAQESIVYLANWADSASQFFALIGADFSMAGQVAQLGQIALIAHARRRLAQRH
jgi:hypothetical protein